MSEQTVKIFTRLAAIVEKQNQRVLSLNRNETIEEMLADLELIEPELLALIKSQSDDKYDNEDLLAPLTHEQRIQAYSKFSEWLQAEAPESLVGKNYEFKTDIKEGAGVFATRDLEADDLVMAIPRKVIMSIDTAQRSPIADMIKESPLLTKVSSLALTMHLLYERLNPNSYWRPYLDILPSDLFLPIHGVLADLECLKGSANYILSLRQYKSTVRQYIEVVTFVKNNSNNSGKGKAKLQSFSYNAFRWAATTCMARQNRIPSENLQFNQITGEPVSVLCLIPGFDMLNHAFKQGVITTHFDIDSNCSETITPEAVKQGEQVYIFYGDRPNSLLFQYQGFVINSLDVDRVLIPMIPVDTTDPILKIKGMVLNKLGLMHREMTVPFKRQVSENAVTPPPFVPLNDWRDVWKLVNVLTMDKTQLSKVLTTITRVFKDYNSTVVTKHMADTEEEIFQDDCQGETRTRVVKALVQHLEQQLTAYPNLKIQETGDSATDCFRNRCAQFVKIEQNLIQTELNNLRK